jgi:hypothetical protein
MLKVCSTHGQQSATTMWKAAWTATMWWCLPVIWYVWCIRTAIIPTHSFLLVSTPPSTTQQQQPPVSLYASISTSPHSRNIVVSTTTTPEEKFPIARNAIMDTTRYAGHHPSVEPPIWNWSLFRRRQLRREIMASTMAIIITFFYTTHPACALDMDAFAAQQLIESSSLSSTRSSSISAATQRPPPSTTPTTTSTFSSSSSSTMSTDEAVCRFAQPSTLKGDACVRAGLPILSNKKGGVDAYGNIDRYVCVLCVHGPKMMVCCEYIVGTPT